MTRTCPSCGDPFEITNGKNHQQYCTACRNDRQRFQRQQHRLANGGTEGDHAAGYPKYLIDYLHNENVVLQESRPMEYDLKVNHFQKHPRAT
jgi:hypothetical protein